MILRKSCAALLAVLLAVAAQAGPVMAGGACAPVKKHRPAVHRAHRPPHRYVARPVVHEPPPVVIEEYVPEPWGGAGMCWRHFYGEWIWAC